MTVADDNTAVDPADKKKRTRKVRQPNPETDHLWGVPAIGAYLGCGTRAARYLIKKFDLPVKKIGKRLIHATKSQLDARLAELEASGEK